MTVQQERLHEVAASFHTLAEVRGAGGYAPIYQQMAASVAGDSDLLAIAAAKPGQNPPSLLLGATQFLLADHSDHPLVRFYPTLTGLPAPTDDPYPALLTAQHLGGGQPLTLIEIGPSAGLTLLPDRYAYDYGTGALHGDPTSPLVLRCALRGELVPPLDDTLSVRWRTGVDVNPLNLANPADRQWLRALIWPDHPNRAQRLDLAARAAARGPLPVIHQGDATERLPELLTQAPDGTTVVVFHTAVLAHFTAKDRTAFVQRLGELSAQRPITWVMGEPRPDDQPRLRLALLANGKIQNERPLGRYHPHGAWLEWVSATQSP